LAPSSAKIWSYPWNRWPQAPPVIGDPSALLLDPRSKPDRRSLFERRSPLNRRSSSDRVSTLLRRSLPDRRPALNRLSSMIIATSPLVTLNTNIAEQVVNITISNLLLRCGRPELDENWKCLAHTHPF